MENPKHRTQMNILIDSLELAWEARDNFYVGGNMFFYFSELQSRSNDFRGPTSSWFSTPSVTIASPGSFGRKTGARPTS